jgi:hypothetical protein
MRSSVSVPTITGDPGLDFFTDDTGKVYEHAANLLMLTGLTQTKTGGVSA